MPTGYTSDIYEGKEVTGKDFIMKCARAFGATIMMRDESLDTAIPEKFEPSTNYYENKIKKAEERLEEASNISIVEAAIQAERQYQEEVAHRAEMIAERTAMRERFERTLSEVERWIPPTPDHQGLKDFCIKQIKETMDFDCSLTYYEAYLPERITAEQYIEDQKAIALRNLTYSREQMEKEIERTNARNQWIKDLRASLVSL